MFNQEDVKLISKYIFRLASQHFFLNSATDQKFKFKRKEGC